MPSPVPEVTSGDLAGLPEPVARWLERIGVPGRPRIGAFDVRFQAAIRDGPRDRWMVGRAEQRSALGPPRRLFLMRVRRGGVPVTVYHRFGPGGAAMEARLLGVVPVMQVDGEEMARSETVTFLNDLVLLAPAGLLELDLEWLPHSPSRVGVRWENRGHAVTAELRFDPSSGTLVDFVSDDRLRSTGSGFEPARWRTPILSRRRTAQGLVLPREAQAWWETPAASWCYARFVVESVEVPPGR